MRQAPILWRPRLLFRVDALVEANRRLQFLLKLHVPVNHPNLALLDLIR